MSNDPENAVTIKANGLEWRMRDEKGAFVLEARQRGGPWFYMAEVDGREFRVVPNGPEYVGLSVVGE